ncbi:MAG TPA: hypothetical protein VMT16_03310 [Thermoanaerobaculia bacterium]|nr:hypothetical protein [Thermoanaerobaculia bacterium]
MQRRYLSLCAAALLAALPTAASGAPPANPSVDQFRQIDQHCALNTGCFRGDDPGFPVTITESGSYFLTGNLDVTGEDSPLDTTAIVLAAPGIALDLAGYSLIGVVGCAATPVSGCSGTGAGVGIKVNAFNTGAEGKGAKITNGTIRGFGNDGIQCDTDCWIDAVLTMENAGHGIDADFGDHHSTVLRSQSVRNAGDGIRLRGLVADSTARGNGVVGIRVIGRSGAVRGCTVNKNGWGISAQYGTASGNTF